MSDEQEGWTVERKLAVISTFIVLIVPTIGITHIRGSHPTIETAYLWPWMILIRYQPLEAVFATDVYNLILPPSSLFVYIPFLFVLRLCYKQFRMNGDREKIAGLISLAAFSQMFLIWIIYQSQQLYVSENRSIYFIPELLILIIQGYFSVRWYTDRVSKTLRTPVSEHEKQSISQESNTDD